MAEEGSKVGKSEEEMEDRISNLPDGVLNHILSFLPTKTVVAIGRLSRRWRNLWQNLSVLNFTDHSHEYADAYHPERFRTFALLVNGVFATFLRNPRPISKFRLECDYCVGVDIFCEYSVNTWVRSVIGPHLQELELNLHRVGDSIGLPLPQTLLTSTNLVSLTLKITIDVDVESLTQVSLPSLKKLVINVFYVDVPSVNVLLSGCPNIEILDLGFSTESLAKLCIPLSLKRLTLDIISDDAFYLETNAPDLEYLNITFTFGQVSNTYNLHNVVEAHLDVSPESDCSFVPLHNLLGALSRTKNLVLSPFTTEWLLDKPHDLHFQEFQYLVRQELLFLWFKINFNSLLSLLKKCPMLQVLIIQNDKEHSSISGWDLQPSVPDCLVSHLTFIEFIGFSGFPDEVSFVEHVLQKGLVLKTMIIANISLDLYEKRDMLKRLSDVPRGSAICQLKFD